MLMDYTKSSASAAIQENFKMLENPKCDPKRDLRANLNTTGALFLLFYEGLLKTKAEQAVAAW